MCVVGEHECVYLHVLSVLDCVHIRVRVYCMCRCECISVGMCMLNIRRRAT